MGVDDFDVCRLCNKQFTEDFVSRNASYILIAERELMVHIPFTLRISVTPKLSGVTCICNECRTKLGGEIFKNLYDIVARKLPEHAMQFKLFEKET